MPHKNSQLRRYRGVGKRVFLKEAVTLAKEGYDVVHVAPGIGLSEIEKGVLLYKYPPAKGLRKRTLGLYKLFRIARMINADVYHCNEVDSWLIGIIMTLIEELNKNQ